MLRFLRYAALRSLYPLLALAAIWGTLAVRSFAWGPWLAFPLALVMLHLVTYFERWSGPSPPDLVTAPASLGRWLAHPEDVHGLIFCGLHFAAVASAFWLWLHPGVTGFDQPAEKLAFALGAGMWLGWSGGINMGVNYHSHAHKPVLRHAVLNRWLGRLWTLPGGIPSWWWRYKHLAVHHSHLGEDRDWVQPKRRPDGRYENLWIYVFLYWPWRWGYHFWRELRQAPPEVRRRAWREAALFLVPFSLPFFVDPWMALGLWLFPAWVGGAIVMGMGMYTQHAGGTGEQRYSQTTTFLSHFFNLTMFNAGFHVEHHERPGVHWSELPRLHQEMKPDLIAGGAHVVPYGIYRGSSLLSSLLAPERGWRREDGSTRSLGACLLRNFAGHLTRTVEIGRRFPGVYRKLKVMTAVSSLPLLALLALDPAKTAVVFLAPMLLAVFNVARLGYEQHAGLDLDHHLTASRNIENRLYNLVTFNSGYHTAHHLHPGVHWSKLPELHRRIRDDIPAALR